LFNDYFLEGTFIANIYDKNALERISKGAKNKNKNNK
jgi:hypothetical protein